MSSETRWQHGWRESVPVALLLLVAAVQIVLAQTMGLAPWKGGGFGMFAAIDGGAVRSVRILVEGPERAEWLLVPPSLEVDADRAALFPVDFMLARLARKVAVRERRIGRSATRVTVEAWSAALSADGSQAEARRLAAHVHEVHAEDIP